MISESDDKTILSTATTFISGNVSKNDVFSSRNINNDVNDVIEGTIDKDETYDYNKDDHDPPAPQQAIYFFIGSNNTILWQEKKACVEYAKVFASLVINDRANTVMKDNIDEIDSKDDEHNNESSLQWKFLLKEYYKNEYYSSSKSSSNNKFVEEKKWFKKDDYNITEAANDGNSKKSPR